MAWSVFTELLEYAGGMVDASVDPSERKSLIKHNLQISSVHISCSC